MFIYKIYKTYKKNETQNQVRIKFLSLIKRNHTNKPSVMTHG